MRASILARPDRSQEEGAMPDLSKTFLLAIAVAAVPAIAADSYPNRPVRWGKVVKQSGAKVN